MLLRLLTLFLLTGCPSTHDVPGRIDAGARDSSVARDAGSRDAGSRDAGPRDAGLDAAPDRARVLYDEHCALCHGLHGEGYLADEAPAIANADFLRFATDAFIEAAIYDGRPGTPMSPWGDEHGGPFTRADALDVTALVRSFATEPIEDVSAIAIGGDPARGAAIYASECAECHGAAGEGGPYVTLDNAVFHDTASDGFLVRSIEVGRRGTRMPSFATTLSPAEIEDVAAFVRTLRRDPEPKWPIEDPPSADMLVISPGGGDPGFTLRDGRYVPAAEVHAAYIAGRRMVLLDARATSDWALGHIPGAAPFPFYSVDELAASLPDDGTWIIAYCACPHAASGVVVDQLRARGFETTAVLDEGIYFWRDAGYPMARGRVP